MIDRGWLAIPCDLHGEVKVHYTGGYTRSGREPSVRCGVQTTFDVALLHRVSGTNRQRVEAFLAEAQQQLARNNEKEKENNG